MTHKRCALCGKTKPITEFAPSRSVKRSDPTQGYCTPCLELYLAKGRMLIRERQNRQLLKEIRRSL